MRGQPGHLRITIMEGKHAMNAPERLARLCTPQADGLTLRLRTLTPLYTGGIGQFGDQIHPSNLLGGMRLLSCLVARTLGDLGFEDAVWGNAGMAGHKARAKQVAVRWDTAGLTSVKLPDLIRIPKLGGGESKWYFNCAHEGELGLQVARRGISDAHWRIVVLALAIQLRQASFGAKDQFGLGVLTVAEGSRPFVEALDPGCELPPVVPAEPGRLNLLRHAFGRLHFRVAPGQRPNLNRSIALNLALATRASLRNALRAKADAPEAEKTRLTALRHQMLGKLNQFGSAVNVSAAYAVGDSLELRVSVALKPDEAAQRSEIMKAFHAPGTIDSINTLIDTTGYRVDGKFVWEFGGGHLADRAVWLNKLAGVQK